jgi:archaemetzincin
VTPARAILVPFGTISRDLLAQVSEAVRQAYGIGCEVAPVQQNPQYAFNKDRNQYHSAAILRRLGQVKGAAPDVPVIGVADVDLFIPDASFVFGEADRDAMTAVVGLTRLKDEAARMGDAARLRRRAQVEVVHELGHLLGLSHCDDDRCAMFLSQTVQDSDRKGPGLCTSCTAAIGSE